MEELVGDTKSIKKKEVVYNVSQGNQPNWVQILAPLLPGGVTLCLSSLVCMMGLMTTSLRCHYKTCRSEEAKTPGACLAPMSRYVYWEQLSLQGVSRTRVQGGVLECSFRSQSCSPSPDRHSLRGTISE